MVGGALLMVGGALLMVGGAHPTNQPVVQRAIGWRSLTICSTLTDANCVSVETVFWE